MLLRVPLLTGEPLSLAANVLVCDSFTTIVGGGFDADVEAKLLCHPFPVVERVLECWELEERTVGIVDITELRDLRQFRSARFHL